jgi:hypothetical protein
MQGMGAHWRIKGTSSALEALFLCWDSSRQVKTRWRTELVVCAMQGHHRPHSILCSGVITGIDHFPLSSLLPPWVTPICVALRAAPSYSVMAASQSLHSTFSTLLTLPPAGLAPGLWLTTVPPKWLSCLDVFKSSLLLVGRRLVQSLVPGLCILICRSLLAPTCGRDLPSFQLL